MITLPKDRPPHVVAPDVAPPAFEDAPPTFEPYKASYFHVGTDNICSHDPHLNSDGEALYRFLLEQSQRLPLARVNVRGTHTEHRSRWVTERGSDGRSHQRSETYTETVVDFDFCIDIEPLPGTKPIQWSISDNEPAYRGKMVREVEEVALPSLGGIRRTKRKATRREVKFRKQWNLERSDRGLPPWSTPEELELLLRSTEETSALGLPQNAPSPYWVESLASIENHSLRSTKTLRQWADEYCNSPKHLKEFIYDQQIYGWNMAQIKRAIHSTIQSTPYSGTLEINITRFKSRIYVRPDNRLSRMLSNKWLMFLSIILFIYPFIWLFKRFHSRGGGTWKVCGAAYPMKKWVPATDDGSAIPSNTDEQGLPLLPPYAPFDEPQASMSSSVSPQGVPAPSDSPSTSYPSASSRRTSSRLIRTGSGTKTLVGIREGEWFRKWEGALRRAVIARHQSSIPLQDPDYTTVVVTDLDGYMG